MIRLSEGILLENITNVAQDLRNVPDLTSVYLACSQEAAETPRPGAWFRSSALAERLLCHARIVYLENSPCFGQPILFEVKPPTGEPYPGNPELRFGGRGGRVTGPPYPYRGVSQHRAP